MNGKATLALALALAAAGCRSAPETGGDVPPPEVPETPAPPPVTFELGRSVSGRPIEALLQGGDRQKPVVLLLASMHGDESSGTPLLRGLERHLARHPELLQDQAVLMVPVVNPDGFDQESRHNARKIDLNRNFPASSFEPGGDHGPAPLSEPETQALFGLIHSFHPVRVVTIHMQAGCLDFDGPAEELARVMSKHCGLPVRRLGGRPGSLGSYLGRDLDTPVITLELSAEDRRRSGRELLERYLEALVAAIQWNGPRSSP